MLAEQDSRQLKDKKYDIDLRACKPALADHPIETHLFSNGK